MKRLLLGSSEKVPEEKQEDAKTYKKLGGCGTISACFAPAKTHFNNHINNNARDQCDGKN
jgi:hypothetical protein